LVGCQQDNLQAPSGLFALGCFLALQEVLYEWPLIRGKTLAATEQVQKHVTMLDKHGSEPLRSLGYCEIAGMCAIAAA
jgi:hypothetical protein